MNGTLVISLVGFSGSGKTTLGKLLAQRRNMKFLDTDELIERELGEPIERVLSRGREKRFRAVERAVLERVYERMAGKRVIALGGGAFEAARNRRLIQSAGPTVYLSCSMRELYRRLKDSYDRPLLRVKQEPGMTIREARMKRIQELLEKRRVNYESADYRVPVTGKSISECVDALERIVESL
ncbi:AAA family ATPase [bacterium]|nr:AAA family ATPase [bacterium]MCB2201989.1 AAA family ATPase [bacterium]